MSSVNKQIDSRRALPDHPTGFAYLIGRLDRKLNAQLRARLAPFGLTVAQYTFLSVFRTHAHMSNAKLAERSLISPQSANEMVNLMERKGLIARRLEAAQGRVIPIVLTRKGQALLDDCDKVVAQIESHIHTELGEDAFWLLHEQLRNLVRVLKKPE
ncbi:MAG TPA: MarR family transcriptional regulator [Pusillimonas sp.]|jgi:DNA-binding MarR family transcriptional regulator|nr:MarR family transcriptional regulator [Pusillimonas sp.]MBC41911.1 MarR family transcriptional regulator [Pusillimonas sp.]HBT33118.1 MarR family transcriptional regulator [Pusillimonas sp.]HCN72161.1 MarR family transcriptional regulator [Pusillimonas sp.]HCP79215.1 MarR family transcriptional regulator [Pusillimonas sp.]|tara:strand:- start:5 stop:475 length:471 start_codon:yes stop_codon:yes gene_type:complete